MRTILRSLALGTLALPGLLSAQTFSHTITADICNLNDFPYPILTIPNAPPAAANASIQFQWITTVYLDPDELTFRNSIQGVPDFWAAASFSQAFDCEWQTHSGQIPGHLINANRAGNGGELHFELRDSESFSCFYPSSPCIRNFVITYPVQWAFIDADGNENTCPGDAVSFTDESQHAPTSWQWSFPGGIPSTSNAEDPIVVYTTPGSYDVTLISSNGTLTDTIVMPGYVTVQTVDPLVVSPDTAICAGGAVGLYCQGSNAVWAPAAGLNDPFISFPTASPTTTTTYTVEAVALGGCQTSGEVTVTVVPYPVLQVSATDSTVCPEASTSLTVSGAASYLWSPSSSLNADTGAVVSATPDMPTTYSVTGTSGPGCTDEASITIGLHEPPAAPSIIDQGSQLLSSTATGYQWNLSGAPISGANTQTWIPQENGAYTVTITDENGCTATSLPYVVLNVGIPDATMAGITVHFNAATSSVIITGDRIQGVRVLASDGRIIHSEGSAAGSVRIALPVRGMFLLEIRSASGVYGHRIMVP